MLANLRPYPSYEHTSLPWLPRVPADWTVRRLKTVFREVDDRSGRRSFLPRW
jgi:hypothetical protein